ncbi:MAG: zinc ribbon domain-containing protein [Actinomycetota bacterium]|nr:zinc ribbon domain-containing protein [Actinomycetota bacterium]
MVKCEFCGAEVSRGALACPACGAPISKKALEALEAEEKTAPEAEIPVPVETRGISEEPVPSAVPPLENQQIGLQSETPGVLSPEEAGLTGGYKEGYPSFSVGGAGEQTTDDPFGLSISEETPRIVEAEEEGFDFHKVWNIIVTIFTVIIAGAIIAFAVYFGFLREKGPSKSAPAQAVHTLCMSVVSGNSTKVSETSVPNSATVAALQNIIDSLSQSGMVTVKKLRVKTENLSETKATARIEEFSVAVTSPGGEQKVTDILNLEFPNTVELIYQGGKWIVVS